MMTNYVTRNDMQVVDSLVELVEGEILPGLDLSADHVWSSLSDIVKDYSPRNAALLQKREDLQRLLNEWHKKHPGMPDQKSYKTFLYDIGYLIPEGNKFKVSPGEVDPEIASVAGPQLVVPVDNARYGLNAANARWGSLFDALYGTDVIVPLDDNFIGYDAVRGNQVIERANQFLDNIIPLKKGCHQDVTLYDIKGNSDIVVTLKDGSQTLLQNPALFIGHARQGNAQRLLFRHNGLHIETVIDRSHPVGAENSSGVCDIILESALTTIMDCEDSVAAVDGEDKVQVYRNWLGLMKGDLSIDFSKGNTVINRRLNSDREYRGQGGEKIKLPGRSLMLVRNVGHLMTTNAVLDDEGQEIPEGILDVVITSLAAIHDLQDKNVHKNSRTGSIYIVKPKMHGPEEAAFANDLFERVENSLKLTRHTLKIGVMDEERRTTLNLMETIRAVKDRIFFINTGFLDRTGDEIHTDMAAGPMVRKNDMKNEKWIEAYERWNVDVGLEVGMKGKAQIGKGMWAMPEEMKQMMDSKGAQLLAGASCAWVPSPTAATLHAMHYHDINVATRQADLSHRDRASLDDLLQIPLLVDLPLPKDQVKSELDNNCQGLLGYVVRWINQGVGCSKVPDINDVGLMEDRATLRISSQHIANWLVHGICTKDQVLETLKRMAVIVDQQNSSDKNYQNMAPDYDGIAFQAACDLIFKGCEQPSGYTEPILHAMRRRAKRQY